MVPNLLSLNMNRFMPQAGVVKELQALYSPDLNPIEPFFGSVKNRIRKRARQDADLIRGDFKEYLRMQIRIVGQDKKGMLEGWLRRRFRPRIDGIDWP
jgi:transposase